MVGSIWREELKVNEQPATPTPVNREERCTQRRIYRGSFRWVIGGLVLNVLLLGYGLVVSGSSTPPEVVTADIVFLGLSVGMLVLFAARSKWGLFGALILGFIFLLRSIGDPDFMEAAEMMTEEPLSMIPQLAHSAAFVVFSFVQTLSAYAVIILRRAGVVESFWRRKLQ
jgi:hypothetical protein